MANPKLPVLPPAMLRLRDLTAYIGVGRTAIYALRSDDPNFPAPVSVGKRAVAWKRVEIDKWIEKLDKADRPPAEPRPEGADKDAGE